MTGVHTQNVFSHAQVSSTRWKGVTAAKFHPTKQMKKKLTWDCGKIVGLPYKIIKQRTIYNIFEQQYVSSLLDTVLS